MKSPTLKKFYNELIHNKLVLYLLFAISFINLLTYLQHNYLAGIIIFLFIGVLSTYYTNNMIIILTISILLTNLLVSLGFLSNLGLREGLTSEKATDKKTSNSTQPKKPKSNPNSDTDTDTSDLSDDDNDNDNDNNKKCSQNSDCSNKYKCVNNKCVKPYSPIKASELTAHTLVDNDDPNIENSDSDIDNDDPDIKKSKTFKSGFKNLSQEESDSVNIENNNIDNKKLMGDVQDKMTKLLGKNGVQNIDTNNILKQQKELMEAMKNMEPLMQGASKMIDSISNSSIGGILGLNK